MCQILFHFLFADVTCGCSDVISEVELRIAIFRYTTLGPQKNDRIGWKREYIWTV
jgi:hypothetical protein